MDTKTHVALRITSQTLTPEEISSLVGMSADEARKKGEPKGNSAYRGRPVFAKDSRWVVESTLPPTAPPEAHIENLSERLAPYVDNIRALADENDVSFWCAMYIYSEDEYSPGLYFAKETINLLSSLRASLNIDPYFLVGDDTGL